MDLLADFLHFGTNVFLVARRFRAVWSVGRKECSVKCEVWRKQWEVRSVKCGVWSVKCGVWSLSLECEERSVKCEVWSVKEAVRSEKCGVWSVKCGVWSLKFGVRRVQCAVWGVECRGKDTVGTGCLWTIGHLFLGNFRRRLARVYVILYIYILYISYYINVFCSWFPSAGFPCAMLTTGASEYCSWGARQRQFLLHGVIAWCRSWWASALHAKITHTLWIHSAACEGCEKHIWQLG